MSAEGLDREWAIREACKAYGIQEKYLIGAECYPEEGEVVLVTAGGKKVRWHQGVKVEKLTAVEVTGIPPKKK